MIVLTCEDLAPAVAFFEGLGFAPTRLRPADDPALVELSMADAAVRLVRADAGGLAVAAPHAGEPRIEPSIVVTNPAETDAGVGRAGMHYRDLVPGRQGGAVIASEITIADGGEVPDRVHWHQLRFQVLYATAGWVRVQYEDQGPELVMHAGDLVLQPPGIRHRVRESSPGFSIVELAVPAAHDTNFDHVLQLPTGATVPDRDFGGQRFVFAEAVDRTWAPAPGGWERADLGVGAATAGTGRVDVWRAGPGAEALAMDHDDAVAFRFVLSGTAELLIEGHPARPLEPRAAFTVPSGVAHGVRPMDPNDRTVELLDVRVHRPRQQTDNTKEATS